MLGMIYRILCFAMPLSLALGAGLFNNDKYPMDKGRHVIDTGERITGDEVLYSDTLLEKGTPMRHIGNEYCFPPKGSNDQVQLTEYEIKDLDEGNDGGLAFDVSGGVGKNQVCFFLKTQYGKGYRFKVDIYGYRNGRNIPISGPGGYGAVGAQPFGLGGSGFGAPGNHFPPGGVAGNLGDPRMGNFGQPGYYGGPGSSNYGQQGNFGGPNAGFVPQGSFGGPTGYGNAGGGYGNTGFHPNSYGNTGMPYGTPYGSGVTSVPPYGTGNTGVFPYGSGNSGVSPYGSGNSGVSPYGSGSNGASPYGSGH